MGQGINFRTRKHYLARKDVKSTRAYFKKD